MASSDPADAVAETTSDGEDRLDILIAKWRGVGRRTALAWIRAGAVRVDGFPARAGERPCAGALITLMEPTEPVANGDAHPSLPPARLLFATTDLLVFDKRTGVHSHRGRSEPSVASFLDRTFAAPGQPRFAAYGPPEEAGIVHRLDRDTSGLLLVARNADAYARWRRAFREHAVAKQYLALVDGHPPERFIVDTPLARRGAKVRAATRRDIALPARTEVVVLEQGEDWALVRARSRTGAPHQIRAHLALCGHPLVGDATYGGGPRLDQGEGHLLHALRITGADGFDATCAVGESLLGELALRRA